MEFKQLGKYQIVGKIGQGAMGEVFRAHDPVLGRDVAIKTMAAGAGADDHLRKRFRREAQSAARMNHPNIITVHDFGEEQGHIYMAMELLQGDDLKDLILNQVPLSLQEKLSLMEQVCDGLAFAHAHDVVHRDLKPANIHILRGGQVKIMDFGLARISSSDMTRAGVIMGTPNYMSPEQVRGEKATARSDVFSLGAVFYELLGGRKPFDADSLAAILYQVMQAAPEPLEKMVPGLPPALCRVVAKAMSRDGSQRYANGAELREALKEVRGVLAGSPTAEAVQVPPDLASTATAFPATLPVHPPAPTRVVPPQGEVTRRVSRDATALQPSPLPPETLVERQSTLSGQALTQIPASAPLRRPPSDRTELEIAPTRPRPPSRGRLYAGGGLAVAALVVGAFAYRGIRGGTPLAPSAATPGPSPTVLAVSLEGLRASLQDKDYRAASSRAQEVLRLDPGNDEASRAVLQAEGALREIEAASARVRQALEAGDLERASEALPRLVALDPQGSDTTALATRLTDAARARAQDARASMEAARRDARGRGVAPSDLTGPEGAASRAQASWGRGDFMSAAGGFAQARDAYLRAQRPAPVTMAPTARPQSTPPPVLVLQAAPPTLPPASAATQPPVTSPIVPQLSEAATRQAIRGVLDEYRQSFENRNADALRAVQPGVDYEQMKQAFANVTAFGLKLEVEGVTVNGNSATARCLVTYSPVPKPAGKNKPVETVFHLKKTGDLWLIERLQRVEK